MSILTGHFPLLCAHSRPTNSRQFNPALPTLRPRLESLKAQTTFIATLSLRLAKLSRLLQHIPMFPFLPNQPVFALTKLFTSIGFNMLVSPHITPQSLVRPLRLFLLVPRFPTQHCRPLPAFEKLHVSISIRGLGLAHLPPGSLI
jgi:hypothetical protein